MSIRVLEKILEELGIFLDELEKSYAYQELVEYLGIAGGADECEALEQAWLSPEHREAIEEYLKRLKKRKKKEILAEH
ncbi:MAG: hypothetical protein QMD21_00155 [Candidatus Thermoplasmatota archaeon]|nr:hypothetical protein [Candidatus Thermoplasmatota archaeon]MDI6887249.1 hypothetical protein [Candidatus Thermoplasmatota archaeon]